MMKSFWWVLAGSIYAAAGCVTQDTAATQDATVPATAAVAEEQSEEEAALPQEQPEEQSEEQTAQSDVQAEEKTAQVDEQKVVCRRVQVTGSKFVKRVCATQQQWDHTEEEAEEAGRALRQRSRICTGGDCSK